jgi:hypothetical protein
MDCGHCKAGFMVPDNDPYAYPDTSRCVICGNRVLNRAIAEATVSAPKHDRRQYMRELMRRKRRAARYGSQSRP